VSCDAVNLNGGSAHLSASLQRVPNRGVLFALVDEPEQVFRRYVARDPHRVTDPSRCRRLAIEFAVGGDFKLANRDAALSCHSKNVVEQAAGDREVQQVAAGQHLYLHLRARRGDA